MPRLGFILLFQHGDPVPQFSGYKFRVSMNAENLDGSHDARNAENLGVVFVERSNVSF